jgi:phosphate transport system permease protein
MIRGAVFPHGRNGIISASLIGLGRALGETIAVVLVIGSVQNEISLHLFNAGDSMASVIVTQFGEAQGLHRSALVGLGVILFLVTVVVGVIARLVIARSDRRLGVVSR